MTQTPNRRDSPEKKLTAEWLDRVTQSDADQWELAMALVDRESDAAADLPELVELYHQDEPILRQWAMCVMSHLGPAVVDELPHLIRAIQDHDAAVQLGEGMFHEDQRISRGCAHNLRAIATQAPEVAIPDLEKALTHSDSGVIMWVVLAFELLGPRAADSVEAVIPLLQNRNKENRQRIAKLLRKMAPGSERVEQAIANAACDDDYRHSLTKQGSFDGTTTNEKVQVLWQYSTPGPWALPGLRRASQGGKRPPSGDTQGRRDSLPLPVPEKHFGGQH